MRNAIPSFIAISALAAACGGGEDNPALIDAPDIDAPTRQDAAVDAPPQFDFSCMGNAAPTIATDPVTLAGEANGLTIAGQPQISPLPDATITACVGDCVDENELGSTTSQAAGCAATGCAFATGNIATGGMPLDGYLKVAKATFRTTNIFPSEPIRASLNGVPALAISNAAVQALGIIGVNQNDATNGLMAIVVTDCSLNPIPDAVVTVIQEGGTEVGEVFDIGAFAAQLAGTFLVANVPAGNATVNATVNGTALRSHDVQVFVGQTTGTQIAPGFAAP